MNAQTDVKPDEAIVADLIVSGGYVVSMNPRREVFADGAVAIAGKHIIAVGPSRDVCATHRARVQIDASGMLVIPGLIDGHHHPTSYLEAGSADDLDVMTAVFQRLYPYEAALRSDEAYVAATGAFVEMVKSGTTCFNDPGGNDVDAVGEAATVVGLRGIVNRSTRDMADSAAADQRCEDIETCLREGEAVVKRWHGAAEGRLRAWLSVRNVVCVSDDLCRAVQRLAAELGVGIHTHVAASEASNRASLKRFGKRGVERYADLDLLRPNLYLAHAGFVSPDELALLCEHDVKVAHCPGASMHGGFGIIANRTIPEMVQRGITVALGTDTAGEAGFLDMVRTMYLASSGHRDAYADPRVMTAHKVLEMATVDGARACLWEDELGSLAPGKLADLVLVNRSSIEWSHPGRYPVHSLVYSASGADVDTVIIDGRVVMRHREILTVDEEHVKREVKRAGAAVLGRINVRPQEPWPVIEEAYGVPASRV